MKPARSFVRCRTTLATALFAASIASSAALAQDFDTTSAIHYKGLTITPIGFAAAEAVFRTRNITADIGSSYNAIPYDGTSAAAMTEFRATGRQSRIGLMFSGKANDNTLTGYWESDFLSAGVSSNSNESNSYTMRIRQYWGSITTADKLTFAGGQMWSLLTTNKTGMLPRSEAVPLTIEAQYAVGFNWLRNPEFRLVKTDGITTFGLAVDGAQTLYTAHGAAANILIGQTGGSLLNSLQNYSTDLSPDLIGKVAFDPKGYGHWELKGLLRFMRNRVVDPTNTIGGSDNKFATGYGVGFGTWYPVMSNNRDVADIGLSGLWGRGIGRYGTSGMADATIDVDNSLKPIEGAQSLLSIETHPTGALDVYGYGGVEYADRTDFVNAAGKGVGYGSPLLGNAGCTVEAVPTGPYAPASGSPCNADARAFWQGNVGFWYRFYKGAAGTVQYGMQYSYTSKNTWAGLGAQPKATDNMFFSSFRYVLP